MRGPRSLAGAGMLLASAVACGVTEREAPSPSTLRVHHPGDEHDPPVTTIVHRRVRGLSSPYRVDRVTHMEEIWLEDEPPP